MVWLNGLLALGFAVLIPVSFWTGWIHSVTFVSVLSLWALVGTYTVGWQTARAEDKRHEAEESYDEDEEVEEEDQHLVILPTPMVVYEGRPQEPLGFHVGGVREYD